MDDVIKRALHEAGADVIGFSDLRGFLHRDIAHLHRAISIGLRRNLNTDTLSLLADMERIVIAILKESGYRHLSFPAVSSKEKIRFISRLYPLLNHKIAATSAGIGWIGRSGLLISPGFGPRLSLATVVTDATLKTDNPVTESMCGDCRLCVDHCPSRALTGREWSRENPYVELIRLQNCMDYKKSSTTVTGKPNCGLCITICPHGRREYSLKDSGGSSLPAGRQRSRKRKCQDMRINEHQITGHEKT